MLFPKAKRYGVDKGKSLEGGLTAMPEPIMATWIIPENMAMEG
jgi:hypothetical protein